MIGRSEPLKPFELIRWARQQARDKELKPLEAHVLLVLSTYANDQGVAWPSIKTIAEDCGRKPTASGRHSQVSAAIAALESHQLLWTRQGGHGKPAQRELLWNPQRSPLREPKSVPQESSVDNSVPSPGTTAFPDSGPELPGEMARLTAKKRTAREAFPNSGTLTHPKSGNRKKGLRLVGDVFGDLGISGAAA